MGGQGVDKKILAKSLKFLLCPRQWSVAMSSPGATRLRKLCHQRLQSKPGDSFHGGFSFSVLQTSRYWIQSWDHHWMQTFPMTPFASKMSSGFYSGVCTVFPTAECPEWSPATEKGGLKGGKSISVHEVYTKGKLNFQRMKCQCNEMEDCLLGWLQITPGIRTRRGWAWRSEDDGCLKRGPALHRCNLKGGLMLHHRK